MVHDEVALDRWRVERPAEPHPPVNVSGGGMAYHGSELSDIAMGGTLPLGDSRITCLRQDAHREKLASAHSRRVPSRLFCGAMRIPNITTVRIDAGLRHSQRKCDECGILAIALASRAKI